MDPREGVSGRRHDTYAKVMDTTRWHMDTADGYGEWHMDTADGYGEWHTDTANGYGPHRPMEHRNAGASGLVSDLGPRSCANRLGGIRIWPGATRAAGGEAGYAGGRRPAIAEAEPQPQTV